MLITHAYLIGTVGLAIVFAFLCYLRQDLRRVMTYSGLLYLLYMTAVFLFSKLLSSDPSKAINPGYWSPPSILNLNRVTGGLGIEDVFYMFLVGAIAAGLYETIFRSKISKKPNKKLKKGHALSIALIAGALAYTFAPINVVYFFVILQLVGAIAIVWQRHDLLPNALIGGLFFMALYASLFLVFNFLFPSFLDSYYNLQKTSHLSLAGIPLEEFLYSFSLGMMWAPIYEYEHRVKDKKSRSRGLPRFSLANGGGRR